MGEFMKVRTEWLDPNPYSRPQYSMNKIKGIVWHWVANPMTTDYQNKQFFNNREYGNDGYGSAHEIIDLDGSIMLCIPDNEIAYHVGAKDYMSGILDELNTTYPNNCLYGIEITHPDWTGEPNNITYQAMVNRGVYLAKKYNLNPLKDFYRHYDITGKECPRFYVRNPKQWVKFKEEVYNSMNNELKDWQVEIGIEAIKELANDGIIDDADMHIQNLKLGKDMGWLNLEINKRINDKINNLVIGVDNN